MADEKQPIIIKKVKKGGHAHHGGAWKIAYADFVTAMMAFFLLLWLISMTTPEQKAGLADYFAPPNVSPSTSGSGGPMGGTALSKQGAQMGGTSADAEGAAADKTNGAKYDSDQGHNNKDGGTDEATQAKQDAVKSYYDQMFNSAATSIRQAWEAMPELTDMKDNLLIQKTEDGLDIVLMNQQGRAMFPPGSKKPFEHTRLALSVIAPVLQQMPVQIRISGHAAAGGQYPDPNYGPWELTSDRANAVRSILEEYGVTDNLIYSVAGRSTAEPFFPDNPYMAGNERIKITLLNNALPLPPGGTPGISP